MALVPAKCPECGGNINLDPEKKASICVYCKQPFVVQEAIQNFNTTYNITNNTTNEIKADVVNVYENKDKDFIIKGGVLTQYNGASTEVIIPEGVKEIEQDCFRKSNRVVSVSMPDTIDIIGDRAFYECTDLKDVSFSRGLELIGENAFYGCSSLEAIKFPDKLKTVKKGAFSNCQALKRIYLPDSLEDLSTEAFVGDESIEEVYASQQLPLEKYVGSFCKLFYNEIENLAKEWSVNISYFKHLFDDEYRISNINKFNSLGYFGSSEWRTIGAKSANLIKDDERKKLAMIFYICKKKKEQGKIECLHHDDKTGLGHIVFHLRGQYEKSWNFSDCDVAWIKDSIYWLSREEHEKAVEKAKRQMEEQEKEKKENYIKECMQKKICPRCRTPLSILGKCKGGFCPNFDKRVFIGGKIGNNIVV